MDVLYFPSQYEEVFLNKKEVFFNTLFYTYYNIRKILSRGP